MVDNKPIEEIDKEDLVSLLKDKSKELKNADRKVTKLEEGYKKVFKENKNLRSDRENFEKFFTKAFPQHESQFVEVTPGEYKAETLADIFF